MQISNLDIQTKRALLADWFERFAVDAGMPFSQHGEGAQEYTFGVPGTFHVVAKFCDGSPYLCFSASDPHKQAMVDAIVLDAAARVAAGDVGEFVWYSTVLNSIPFKIVPSSLISSMLQQLGGKKRIAGWRRLGTQILLNFSEPEPPHPTPGSPFAPAARVAVHIATAAPRHGFFATRQVNGIIEVIAAVCTLALGQAVDLPGVVFPSNAADVEDLGRRRTSSEILTLAREHVPLDVINYVVVPGGIDIFTRIRAALLTFDAALRQERDPVAGVLFVVAAECLTTPEAEWRQSKLTSRFIDFFDSLIPNELDQLVAHGNFEQAFGIRRGNRGARKLRKELLSKIYDYRSLRVHQGLNPSYFPLSNVNASEDGLRRNLLRNFAESAILGYIVSPRSSLVGHPTLGTLQPVNV